jgi:hypothetical protein
MVTLLRYSTIVVTAHLRALILMCADGRDPAIDQLDTITEDLEHYSECCTIFLLGDVTTEDIDTPTIAKAVQNYRYFNEHPIILGSQKYPIKKFAMLLVRLDYANAQSIEKTSPEVLQIQNDILKIISDGATGREDWTQDIMAKHEVRRKRQKEFFTRVAMALFGGAALVAPMLIMTLHPTKLTTLLTTSLFVFVVAIALAWFMDDAQAKDIMAAAAAYAAVLVVLVGASGNNS